MFLYDCVPKPLLYGKYGFIIIIISKFIFWIMLRTGPQPRTPFHLHLPLLLSRSWDLREGWCFCRTRVDPQDLQVGNKGMFLSSEYSKTGLLLGKGVSRGRHHSPQSRNNKQNTTKLKNFRVSSESLRE